MKLEDINYRLQSMGSIERYENYHQMRVIEFDHERKTVRTYSSYKDLYTSLMLTPKEVAAIYEMIKKLGW